MASNFIVPVVHGTAMANMTTRVEAGSTGHTPAWPFWWRQAIDFAENPGFVGEVALLSGLSQNIPINQAFPDNQFPGSSSGVPGVLKGSALLRLDRVCSGSGIGALTMTLGDGGDQTAWITTTDIFTGAGLGAFVTPGAAEHRPEVRGLTSNVHLVLAADANVDQIDTGRFELMIQFFPMPTD